MNENVTLALQFIHAYANEQYGVIDLNHTRFQKFSTKSKVGLCAPIMRVKLSKVLDSIL